MFLTFRYPTCFAVLTLAIAGGCSSSGLEGTIPIRGKVTYQGTPLESGEVRYVPVDANNGRVARGKLDSSGRYRLTTLKDDDGALPGDYRVVVVVYPEQFDDIAQRDRRRAAEGAEPNANQSQPPIPERYYKPETSGLTDTVDENHSGVKNFDLVD